VLVLEPDTLRKNVYERLLAARDTHQLAGR
jgi:hypothetical protein